MQPLFRLPSSLRVALAAIAVPAFLASCAYPYPYYPYYGYKPATTTVKSAPSFDLSWDAALGAAADAGIQVTNADKGNGRITGTKAGSSVMIDVKPQADNTLHVTFTAPESKETNPTLNERWLVAYQRRMGR